MCGILGALDCKWADQASFRRALETLAHRGPDGEGIYTDSRHNCLLGHKRLRIVDLTEAGSQPMGNGSGRHHIIFNGEVYNYLELRQQLSDYPFTSRSDTEVVLAAYLRWGEGSLNRLLGMFAFAIWDNLDGTLFLARDRLGVKPLYYSHRAGGLAFASEIKALHALGLPARPESEAWSQYLVHGITSWQDRCFWREIQPLPAGHWLRYHNGRVQQKCWYDLAGQIGDEEDSRSAERVCEEYLELAREAVNLRFRSDVEVAVCLSGGLDSSLLVGLINERKEKESLRSFTFVTGDVVYDEWPSVKRMLSHTGLQGIQCPFSAKEVPGMAQRMSRQQDEPFGGVPTLAYGALFQRARASHIVVLLDGQGMDEAWAGYDYYQTGSNSLIQGTLSPSQHTPWLNATAAAKVPPPSFPTPFRSKLRNLQLRDLLHTKLPRALRYNDRASMAAGCELREPFLDHRLVELAMRQRDVYKVNNNQGKWLLRHIASGFLPAGQPETAKRTLQTPQREWLKGPLAPWVDRNLQLLGSALDWAGSTALDAQTARAFWQRFRAGKGDNSNMIWQWLSLCIAYSLNQVMPKK